MLDDADFLRYSRQIMLPMCQEQGIATLQQSSVAVIGLGGLGCIAAPYLAGAGVGRMLLVDDDLVSTSNLPRQWLYADQVGTPKAIAAQGELRRVNPACQLEVRTRRFSAEHGSMLAGVDAVLDCTDNMATRQHINAACFDMGIPLVSAAAIGTEAQCIAISPQRKQAGDNGCYRCLYPFTGELEKNCGASGVLGPVVGMAASLQASLAIQLLLREEDVQWSVFWRMDSATMQTQRFKLPKDPHCNVCSGV